MQVEIWSDIACPFCYIGKRRFEAALAQFEGRENVQSEFEEDINMARHFQITGVPFFVFDRKYAVSGAQEVRVFLETLQKVK
jgi:predicted DsbA family dithiol-disulfide isomerase